MHSSLSEKQLFVFDLDGTLAKSKTPMEPAMVELFTKLLKKRKIAVIGGGWLPVFEWQLLEPLKDHTSLFSNLFLFPTSGATFLRYEEGAWKQVYAHQLSQEQRMQIKEAFEKAFIDIGYQQPETLYGDVIEDRGTQVTFSALGQKAPIELKHAYTGSSQDRRREIVEALKTYVSDVEIKIPGTTSIDVTMKGIDKGYGIEQMVEYLGIPVEQMIFSGDALYEGGNDEAVKRTGIETVSVADPEDTMRHMTAWLTELT